MVHVTGDPILQLSIGGNTRDAAFTTGSGTSTLHFRYTVQAGDLDEDGISIASGALQGGEITSASGAGGRGPLPGPFPRSLGTRSTASWRPG